MHIDICIATYKRPGLLQLLLMSLMRQALPNGVSAGIIVVDNDPSCSGRATVEQAAANSVMPIRYFTQPLKNIALTRNLGVANSTGELLAFIDDDERADDGWLKSLYDTLVKYDADVVFGPVIGELPADAPKWAAEGRFFQSEPETTGAMQLRGATNNALVRIKALPDPVAPFNPRYGLTGGEDTDLFERMRHAGARLVWCNEAKVRENIPAERATLGWLVRRSFRGGQMFVEICGHSRGAFARLRWFFYRLSLALAALAGAILSLPLRRAWFIRCSQRLASNIGQLSTLMRYRYEEYGDK